MKNETVGMLVGLFLILLALLLICPSLYILIIVGPSGFCHFLGCLIGLFSGFVCLANGCIIISEI